MTKQEYLEIADEIESVDPELAAAMRQAVADGKEFVIEINLNG